MAGSIDVHNSSLLELNHAEGNNVSLIETRLMRVLMLTVAYPHEGKQDFLHLVLLHTSEELILVDCGYAGFADKLEKAANAYGLSLQQLTGIIITHHDVDHVGGLYEIKERYPTIKVYSPPLEKQFIEGTLPSLRLQQAEALLPYLPEESQPAATAFQDLLRSVKPVAVDEVLPPDESISFLPGVFSVSTSGHMPGHISLYLPDERILIAADAIVIENGEIEIANPQFTLDLKQAVQSVYKLSLLKPLKIICYHGGVLEVDIEKNFERLLVKYRQGL